MIIFVYGTTAEAIKFAPIMKRLERRGIAFEQWLTYQHTDALDATIKRFELPEPTLVIARGCRGKPLKKTTDALRWIGSVSGWTLRNAWAQRRRFNKNQDIVLVHGDTMTSVVGAVLARVIGLRSAHVEAGLRSGNWRHPFPEELDRRIVGRLASVHYAPSDESAHNLRTRKNVVHTNGNTVIDAALDGELPEAGENESEYGVVLLHRFEFISNKDLVDSTIKALAENAPFPLRVLVDAYARDAMTDAINRAGAADQLVVQEKLAHREFIRLLRGARFIVTDSGGIQEESALYGVPTLIHRMATERPEGIGRNALLSLWHDDAIAKFLANYENYRLPLERPAVSPSDVIVDDLVARGYSA